MTGGLITTQINSVFVWIDSWDTALEKNGNPHTLAEIHGILNKGDIVLVLSDSSKRNEIQVLTRFGVGYVLTSEFEYCTT